MEFFIEAFKNERRMLESAFDHEWNVISKILKELDNLIVNPKS